jgi:imidazolonepropionase
VTADILIQNVRVASCDPQKGPGWGAVQDAALTITDCRISWLGANCDASSHPATSSIDAAGQWLTPGLIDCHTHLVYGGNRAQEFAQRLEGVPYAEISRRGGGILSTVDATRAASEDRLFELALPRLLALAAEGVCTVEIKSGYGLDLDSELKMLRVARQLGRHSGVHVVTTLLGAHALPREFNNRADDYIQYLCEEIMPAAQEQGLADAVDVFCESIAFDLTQCERVFQRAQELGLPVKGHVEQLTHSGCSALIAEHSGLSVDHLEHLAATDIPALQQANTVCVLLPGAFYTLGETHRPPIALMREAGLQIAVASDLNPGSSPLASLLLNMNMASVLFGLTPSETLLGTTRHAAAALGLGERKGRIAEGYDADLVLWDIEDPAQLSYGYNLVRPAAIWRDGQDAS